MIHAPSHCAQAIAASLDVRFGPMSSTPEVAAYLAPALSGKTPVQIRRILKRLCRIAPLSGLVPFAERGAFAQTVIRGLRNGGCLAHQQAALPVAFGNKPDDKKDDNKAAAPQVDPNMLINNLFNLGGQIFGLASTAVDAEARRTESANLLEAALASSGANEATIQALQDQLNESAGVIAGLQGQVASGAMTQDQFQAAVALEAEKLANDANSQGLSSGAIAALTVGGVGALALLGFVFSRGRRAVAYDDYYSGESSAYDDYYSGESSCGCGG